MSAGGVVVTGTFLIIVGHLLLAAQGPSDIIRAAKSAGLGIENRYGLRKYASMLFSKDCRETRWLKENFPRFVLIHSAIEVVAIGTFVLVILLTAD